jgi:hypothetical protein
MPWPPWFTPELASSGSGEESRRFLMRNGFSILAKERCAALDFQSSEERVRSAALVVTGRKMGRDEVKKEQPKEIRVK